MKRDLSFVNEVILSQAAFDQPRELDADFRPGRNDVICSKGAESYNHAGNNRFRKLILSQLERYEQASKPEKTLIVSSIVETIRDSGGSFIRQNIKTQRWHEVGNKLARDKAGQAIRSFLRKSKARSAVMKMKAAAMPLRSTQQEEPKIAKANPENSCNPPMLPLDTTATVATGNCKTPSADTITNGDTASLPYSEIASQIPTSAVSEISSKGIHDKNQSFDDLEPLDWKDGGQLFRYDSFFIPMHEKKGKHESSNSTPKTTTTMFVEPLPYRYEPQPQTATRGYSFAPLDLREHASEVKNDKLDQDDGAVDVTMPPSLLRFESGCSTMTNLSFASWVSV